MSLYLLFMSLVFTFQANADQGALTQSSLSDDLKKNWNADASVSGKATANQLFNSVADLNCDSKAHDKAILIVKALEDRADAIKKFTSAHSQTQASNYFQVGPATFREEKTNGQNSNGWVTQSFGWDEAYQHFLEIQNSAVDEKWALLNRDVRAILREDQKRIVSNLNLEISHSEWSRHDENSGSDGNLSSNLRLLHSGL